MTLLGLGHFPASHVLNLGMMGMHGEAWVNTAIQEADLLIALGMRFDDRVTGNLKTYAPNAKKIHVDIDPSEINKNVKVDVALVGDLRKILQELLPRLEMRDRQQMARIHPAAEGRFRRARHSESAGQRPSLRRARDQRSVARDARQRNHRRHRRGPAPDVGSAVLQARPSALADHLRRPGNHGLCPARGHRREGGLPGFGRLGGRRRRRLPDDHGRACHHRAGKSEGEHRHHQQRLPGHGAPVAGILLRPELRSHAAAQPRLHEARRGLRHPQHHLQHARRRGPHHSRRARAQRPGADRFPGRAGRYRLSDGGGGRFAARNDSAARARSSKPRETNRKIHAAYIHRLRGKQAGRALARGFAVPPPRVQY